MNLLALNPAQPHNFYLTNPSLAALSDCFADVDGVRLPLHSQVLSLHSTVLCGQILFLAQRSANSGVIERPDLTAAFAGCPVADAACLLRMLYHPQDVRGASFAALLAAGRLPAVAALAYKLNVPSVLSALAEHLAGVGGTADMPQLMDALQTAQHCHLDDVAARLLDSIAAKLATASTCVPAALQPAALAALDSTILAQLLFRLAQSGPFRPPAITEVRSAGVGSVGGFTFAVGEFSKQEGVLRSPWVEIGGIQWRLRVDPRGSGDSAGTHLSVYLHWNCAAPELAGISGADVRFKLSLLGQVDGAGASEGKQKDHTFSRKSEYLGWREFIPLAQLRDAGRGLLVGDRLLVRADITVLSTHR